MSSKTDYLENAVINHFLRNSVQSAVAPYVGLFTVAPTDAGGGTEVTVANGYSRQSIQFSVPSPAGVTSNAFAVSIPAAGTATGSWGTVVAFGIFDAPSGGNLLYWGNLSVSKIITSGDIFAFAIGAIDITES